MKRYYLAVDIGASSGRHILGWVEDGRIKMEEMHRFENGMSERDGEWCWDVDYLFGEIKTGMKKCREAGRIPVSMGIDTWGVDFVLLDDADRILGNTVGYRDNRTEGMDARVYELITEAELYGRTGIQKQIYNTIYQLMALKEQHPEYLEAARTLLMMPDYFHFMLTGVKASEYTEATTSQLINPETKDWDGELLDILGYPRQIFQKISKPGTVLGELTQTIRDEVGFNCRVVLPASHDTGSAVLAVPSNEDKTMYISSGTWSLMGVERKEADCSPESKRLNFTNEGGYDYRFRYLKNIMGLWMIQSLKRELHNEYSFAQLCELAAAEDITALVDCYDPAFLAPASMITAVREACRKQGEAVPETPGQLAAVIYKSLAACYGATVREIESRMNTAYDKLYIVGGGANADYLNQLTADATGITVLAGVTEATAIGNMMVQMLAEGEWQTLAEARSCVFDSFAVRTYQ